MKTQLRDLVADALYGVKAHTLPTVCERYGIAPGSEEEAFNSKIRYVMARLHKLSDEKVLGIAKEVVKEFPDDKLQAAIEAVDQSSHIVSDITRRNMAEALNGIELAGKQQLLELLEKHFPQVHSIDSIHSFEDKLADDIYRHVIANDDWSNDDLLERVGFLTCSQARLFLFIEDVLYPARRDEEDQIRIVAKLNPLLLRDGYAIVQAGTKSGYPIYSVREVGLTASPADDLISTALSSFDEEGVHAAWRKALERRKDDPEGAITAARALLETVCKHIIDEEKGVYGEKDDLPKLYTAVSRLLNLAPSQHTEQVFKGILGNAQAVVEGLGTIRNRLGDSHGQGKRYVRPQARHAELAVNLAGSVAMFLIETWRSIKQQ